MAWVSTTNHWIYVTASLGINRSISPLSSSSELKLEAATTYAYKSNRYYYYTTSVTGNFTTNGVTFSLTPAYSSKNPANGETTSSYGVTSFPVNSTGGGKYFNTYQPLSNSSQYIAAKYRANGGTSGFTGSLYINASDVKEIEWLISGYKQFGLGTTSSAYSDINYDGWSYDSSLDTFWWTTNPTPFAGMTGLQDPGVTSSNFIGKQVTYGSYNISFQYQTFLGTSSDGIDIYIGSSPTTKEFVVSLTQSSSAIVHKVYGLTGGGNWIFFVGNQAIGSTAFAAAITNISVEGGYHPDNNEQFLFTNGFTYSDPTELEIIGASGATYSFVIGIGDTITNTFSSASLINSKFGNGTFEAGVWENGVWNSGWRVDQNVYDFDDVYLGIKTIADRRWRIQINGPTSSTNNFSIGDKVSIGNIVAIDINEERKLLRGYFTITNKSDTSIVVEIDSNFPYRRIERDSPYHKIKITKNVWLNGGFLNGYFSGVWNYGLFKGFPKITEMYSTHWIDGIFDGGHFNSIYLTASFADTYYYNGSLGLTFSNPHPFYVGDIILIDKDNKTINTHYDGTASIIEVIDEYLIITDKSFGSSTSSETGLASNIRANALIQNFKFTDNNVANKTSAQSDNTEDVFQYYSWIDVNYYNSSAVNIGKPISLFDTFTRTEYSQNNLYGYPTYDVLSSESKFRDSYSRTIRGYKLGTKYKVYNDFIGQGSEFDRPFDMGTSQNGIGLDTFIDYGWTFSISPTNSTPVPYTYSSAMYSRSFENTSQSLTDEDFLVRGEELIIDSSGKGSVLNNANIDIEKYRYSVIEMDVLTYSTPEDSYVFIPDPLDGKGSLGSGVLHFNNLNQYQQNVVLHVGPVTISYQVIKQMDYLPIYNNINHLSTSGTKKYEYFYNKKSLSLTTLGSGTAGAGTFSITMDNLKFYEIDMIPFFQYFTEENIYQGVVIPYQGIAPFIDYTSSNFSFIDNINIGLDSISTEQSLTPISGVGIGIGFGSTTIPIFTEGTASTSF